jgi:asparagine synthase (glutamine-hydrolysing)
LKLAFEGRIYPTTCEIADSRKALSKIDSETDSLYEFVEANEGAYAAAVIVQDRLLVARDQLGCKPLYWSGKDGVTAFASERKALWAAGMNFPEAVPPGTVFTAENGKVSFDRTKDYLPSAAQEPDLGSAACKLSEMIVESIRKKSGDLRRVAVAYSGGVDSAVLASSCRLAGLEVELFTVTMKNDGEFEHAKRSGKAIGLPLATKQHSLADLKEAIPKVISRVEKPDLTSIAIAVPVLWTAQLAREQDLQAIFVGEGADEMFGGYDRYISAYQREGPDVANRLMTGDVQNLHQSSLERDEQATAGCKVELRCPFIDRPLIRYVLSLPMNLRIGGVQEADQKLVLREVARLQGIPDFIAKKPKRAVQYTTGVAASIKLLAKQQGLSPHEYILEHFSRIRRNLSDES